MNTVINLDKPAQMSSQQAVTKVKRLLGAKKAGHAGTLDPIAIGVLIICLNEATKITRFLSDLDKEYIFQLKLGERTDTYDSTGKIIEVRDAGIVAEEDVHAVLTHFTGSIQQTPPMYSAVKIGGKRLYALARKGITVERPERRVIIHDIELLSFDKPYVLAKVRCSKGTYIRTLCDDIGNSLGTGAHMTALKRIRVGQFRIEDAVSFVDLLDKGLDFYSIDDALSHLREVILDPESWRKARNGIPVDMPDGKMNGLMERTCGDPSALSSPAEEYVRMKSPEHVLFGVGTLVNNSVRPERLLHIS